MKVFKMNECDWYLAKNHIDAKKHYALDVGEFDDNEDAPEELSDGDMATLMFTFEDGKKLSFADHLKNELIKNTTEPRLFASTEC